MNERAWYAVQMLCVARIVALRSSAKQTIKVCGQCREKLDAQGRALTHKHDTAKSSGPGVFSAPNLLTVPCVQLKTIAFLKSQNVPIHPGTAASRRSGWRRTRR